MLTIYLMIAGVLCEYLVPFTQTAEHKKILEEGIKTYAPKLKIVPCDKGMCAEALEDIGVKELIISLPIAFKLTRLDNTPLVRPGVPENYRHFFNLLYYKFMDTSSSFLSAAIHSYPIEFDVPLNWTESDLDTFNEISFQKVHHNPNSINAEMCDYFNKNYDPAKYPRELFECESWKWAKMIFQTRSFKVSVEDFHNTGTYLNYNKELKLETLIPILDLLNHDSVGKNEDKNNFRYASDPPTLGFGSFRKYSKGQEVFNYYEALNSFNFLKSFGFVPAKNPEDSLNIALEGSLFCRGIFQQKSCQYKLSVKGLNKEFLTSMTDYKTELAPTDSLLAVVDALVNKEPLGLVDEEEFEIVVFAGRLYRFELIKLYFYLPNASLREIRRQQVKQSTYRHTMMYQFAAAERKTYFECLKHVDRALLQLMHHALF